MMSLSGSHFIFVFFLLLVGSDNVYRFAVCTFHWLLCGCSKFAKSSQNSVA